MHGDLHCGEHVHHAGVSIFICGCDSGGGDGEICRLLPGGGGVGCLCLSPFYVRQSGNSHGVDLYYLGLALRGVVLSFSLEGRGGNLPPTAAENSFPSDGQSLLHGVFLEGFLPQDLLFGLLFLERDRPSLDISRLFRDDAGAGFGLRPHARTQSRRFWQSEGMVFSHSGAGIFSGGTLGRSFSSSPHRHGGNDAFEPHFLRQLLFGP